VAKKVSVKSFNYDETDIHSRYAQARSLSDETVRLWLERLSRYVSPVATRTIVDVGCGTGRFTGALAAHFAGRVYGIEPSTKMLDVVRAALVGQPVELQQGCAESMPLGDHSADLIFLSMVYHHIQDKVQACKEFWRVLKPDGYLCIRTPTREQLDSYLWISFFPGAGEIEVNRTPSTQELTAFVEDQGFELQAREIVRQAFARDLNEYAEKIGLRGLSSLQAISDRAFERDMARLRAYCTSKDDGQPVWEDISLFVFRPSASKWA
jgi:ubiquinone/menaquinone biosynthesis C-methylase UbiE